MGWTAFDEAARFSEVDVFQVLLNWAKNLKKRR
jgi:hypothetical protein